MNEIRFMDAHLHLQDERFGADAAAIIERAEAAGIVRMLCNGTRPGDWEQVLKLATKHRSVVPFVGVHPWSIDDAKGSWMNDLEAIVKTHRCGIGEVGLDFTRPIDRAVQKEIFECQLVLGKRYARPISIHCVKAWGGLGAVLRDIGDLPAGFMVHAFNGSAETAAQLVKLGGYCSFFAPSFTAERRTDTARKLSGISPERILIETESPYGLNKAVDFIRVEPGRPNEPANLPAIVAEAAKTAGKKPEEFARTVYENSMRFIQPIEEAIL